MFNELNSVENFVRDILCGPAPTQGQVAEPRSEYRVSKEQSWRGLGWEYLPAASLPRQTGDVLVEAHLRDALIRLNPEIADRPDRADEVLYRLRAILLSVHSDGLVRANEEFTAWLRGERSMPFGSNNQHTTVKLIDFENWRSNRCVVTQQYTFQAGEITKRFDLVLLVNGIPLVIGEAKAATRLAANPCR